MKCFSAFTCLAQVVVWVCVKRPQSADLDGCDYRSRLCGFKPPRCKELTHSPPTFQSAEWQSRRRTAACHRCRVAPRRGVAGCLAGASPPRPTVPVSVSARCTQVPKRQRPLLSSLVLMKSFHLQLMAPLAASCPHLGLGSPPARLPPVQRAFDDEG